MSKTEKKAEGKAVQKDKPVSAENGDSSSESSDSAEEAVLMKEMEAQHKELSGKRVQAEAGKKVAGNVVESDGSEDGEEDEDSEESEEAVPAKGAEKTKVADVVAKATEVGKAIAKAKEAGAEEESSDGEEGSEEEGSDEEKEEKKAAPKKEMATEQSPQKSKGGEGELFVGNLSFNLTQEQISAFFSKYGEVAGVKIIERVFIFTINVNRTVVHQEKALSHSRTQKMPPRL